MPSAPLDLVPTLSGIGYLDDLVLVRGYWVAFGHQGGLEAAGASHDERRTRRSPGRAAIVALVWLVCGVLIARPRARVLVCLHTTDRLGAAEQRARMSR
jgi:hypothetical protein